MISLLLIPTVLLLAASFSPYFKQTDREKIQLFFEIAGIGVKHNNEIQYPSYKATEDDDLSTTYIFRLPLGIPSKLLEKIGGVVGEGLNKPVLIKYENYELRIRVFTHGLKDKVTWCRSMVREDSWEVPVGQMLEGMAYHDFDKIPHASVGGTTRYGKTVFLKNIVTNLILANPDNVRFYIFDLKGGLEFSRYKNLKQVMKVAENTVETFEVLEALLTEIRKKMEYMKHNYITNIVESDEKERVFILVDEAAELCPDKSMPKPKRDLLGACQHMLSEIARLGGGLGYRLVFCTQYPTADTLPRQIKQNSDAKIGFRLATGVASQVVIDEDGLEKLPSLLPGRAIYKTDCKHEMQVPYISDKHMWHVLKDWEVTKDEPKPVYEVPATEQARPSDTSFIEFK